MVKAADRNKQATVRNIGYYCCAPDCARLRDRNDEKSKTRQLVRKDTQKVSMVSDYFIVKDCTKSLTQKSIVNM